MILFKKSQLLRGLTMLLLIKTYTVCTGQSQISGKVTEVSGAPLGYANILLLQARDSAFIKGEIAKDDGAYYFKGIADGDYLCN